MEPGSPLWTVLWHVGGFLCHQLPNRSPQFMGVVFPLCHCGAKLHPGNVFCTSCGGAIPRS